MEEVLVEEHKYTKVVALALVVAEVEVCLDHLLKYFLIDLRSSRSASLAFSAFTIMARFVLL